MDVGASVATAGSDDATAGFISPVGVKVGAAVGGVADVGGDATTGKVSLDATACSSDSNCIVKDALNLRSCINWAATPPTVLDGRLATPTPPRGVITVSTTSLAIPEDATGCVGHVCGEMCA